MLSAKGGHAFIDLFRYPYVDGILFGSGILVRLEEVQEFLRPFFIHEKRTQYAYH